MKRIASLIVIVSLLGLSIGCTEYHQQGAGTGAVIGGVSGALIDHRNPWRGGIIGGIIGAVAGATLADISYQASREAAMHDRPVEYRTENGRGIYRAEPVGYNDRTRCKRIHERVWEDDRLVKDQVREICEDRYERRY
ncbi:MAG: glycine zipper 2TM domain-containing protein [Nitrospirae bacterium]|nr:MAG: glycine zipper 2TM domain-containing protein [Nitrospirota bacterium]